MTPDVLGSEGTSVTQQPVQPVAELEDEVLVVEEAIELEEEDSIELEEEGAVVRIEERCRDLLSGLSAGSASPASVPKSAVGPLSSSDQASLDSGYLSVTSKPRQHIQ